MYLDANRPSLIQGTKDGFEHSLAQLISYTCTTGGKVGQLQEMHMSGLSLCLEMSL